MTKAKATTIASITSHRCGYHICRKAIDINLHIKTTCTLVAIRRKGVVSGGIGIDDSGTPRA